MWTKKDNDFLRINYPTKTAGWCADHLKKSKVAIHLHVRVLGLSAVGRKGCRKTREILRKISEDFVICFCPKHDETEHKRSANGCVRCVLCGTENNAKRKGNRISTDHTRNLAKLLQRKRRSTQIAKYVDRLRSCLYQCGVGRISFSKHFPYGAKQLCEYLEKIRTAQGNRCPSCGQSYNEVKDSIDHIIPISSAKTVDRLLELFSLSNLSLLCLSCNASKGDRM